MVVFAGLGEFWARTSPFLFDLSPEIKVELINLHKSK